MIHPLVQAIFSAGGGAAPQPSCAITLTGDIAAVFGGQPLDISGQTVSKTVPETPANFYAAGGPAVPVSWAGWRGIGYQASDYTTALDSYHGIFISTADVSNYVLLVWDDELGPSGGWSCLVDGVLAMLFLGTPTSKVGMRIDGSTGDVEVIVDGVIKTKADAPALGGALAGLTVLPASFCGTPAAPTLTEGDAYEAQVYTAAADLADVGFPAGTLDWCGDVIPDGPCA